MFADDVVAPMRPVDVFPHRLLYYSVLHGVDSRHGKRDRRREAVTQAHHEECARVVLAALTRRFGDLDIAEEVAAEASVAASSGGRPLAEHPPDDQQRRYRPTPQWPRALRTSPESRWTGKFTCAEHRPRPRFTWVRSTPRSAP